MFNSDVRHVKPAGPAELPPYYARLLQPPPSASPRSARYGPAEDSTDAEAIRLFRDFKLGLLTLVIVSLLLLAYFWDGAGPIADRGALGEPQEDVLSFSLTAQRRGERLPHAYAAGRRRKRTAARSPASRRRTYVYTVRGGDTLSAIALRLYGDASLWKEILGANGARLRRPSDLRAGMKLVVPCHERLSSTNR